jgi:hypothetical protein
MAIGERQGAKLANRLGQPINTAAIVLMGVYTILWGFWVGNPFWSTFHEAKQYDWMSRVMPEMAWGLTAIAVGVVMCVGVIKNSYHSLSIGSFIGAIYWGTVAAGYYIGDWRDTAGLTKTMICVYCAFIFLNIRMNHDRLVD